MSRGNWSDNARHTYMETVKRKFKNWVLSWSFVRQQIYSRIFKAAQDDMMETFVGDVDKEAEIKAKKLLNDLLSPVDLTSIVRVDKTHGILYIGEERATDLQLTNLKAEAEALQEYGLWKLLYETPKSLAEREMFVSGDNLDAMKKGRSILYTLSTQKNILDVLLSYQQAPKKSLTTRNMV